MIIELTGAHGDNRRSVQGFLQSVFSLRISQGAIQKIVDRSRQALTPHYAAVQDIIRSAQVNHADETTWKRKNSLEWLWLLCNTDILAFIKATNASLLNTKFQAINEEHSIIL
jgi:hypothetical protein